ncbi:DNA-directed RNA polymerase subunit alpha [compost metagenome]
MAKQKILRVFEIYQSNRSGQWGWRSKSFKNGKTTFSGEPHPSEGKALRAIKQELSALGATNTVRIDVISGNKRSFDLETMAPLTKSIDKFVKSMKKAEASEKPEKVIYLLDMGFSSRALNVLRAEGLVTASELARYLPEEVGKLPGMGEVSLQNVKAVLKKHGLQLSTPAKREEARDAAGTKKFKTAVLRTLTGH